jgi:valyl-tRNA synthetase
VLDLVRAIRNARAEARLEPGVWLPIDVSAPPALAPTLESLASAVTRLARARPLRIHADRAAMAAAAGTGGLSVVAAELEAVVGRATAAHGGDVAVLERARLEKELAHAEKLLAANRARLANDAFTARAPGPVVEAVRIRQEELIAQVARLAERRRSVED